MCVSNSLKQHPFIHLYQIHCYFLCMNYALILCRFYNNMNTDVWSYEVFHILKSFYTNPITYSGISTHETHFHVMFINMFHHFHTQIPYLLDMYACVCSCILVCNVYVCSFPNMQHSIQCPLNRSQLSTMSCVVRYSCCLI